MTKHCFQICLLQEQLLKEWLDNHPILYDRAADDYIDTTRKDALWKESLELVHRTAPSNRRKDNDVYNWYLSIRTVLSKLLHRKSGDKPLTWTTRRRFIYTFEFLKPHSWYLGGSLFNHIECDIFSKCRSLYFCGVGRMICVRGEGGGRIMYDL